MQKKRNITLLLAMSFAILVFCADRAAAECSQAELDYYECSVDAQGYFQIRTVEPFPAVAPCSDDLTQTCSSYTYQIIKQQIAPHGASHLNLIVEQPFADLIVGGGLDCDGSGDNSTTFARYLTWNCYYKWSDISTAGYVTLEVRGETDSSPSEWFIKASNDTNESDNLTPYAWGIIQAPDLLAAPKPIIIARTLEVFSYISDSGLPYTVTIHKNQAGEISKIIRTYTDPVLGEVSEDITNTGMPIEFLEVSYDGGDSFEPLTFIPDGTVLKTGEHSTCGYMYNGFYYNFCGF
jgi:hypothetical protein